MELQTRGMEVVAFLVIILGCLLELNLVQACTCLPKHPQQHYCNSDYAIRVKIYDQHLKLPNGQRYNISDPEISSLPLEILSQSHREWSGHIQRVYKAYDQLKKMTMVKLYTPFYDSMCGVGTLQHNEVYVIMGTFGHRGLTFDFCDWHRPWRLVSPKQRRGLRYWYMENCLCQIETCGLRHPCGWYENEPVDMACEWDAWDSRCTNQYSACVMTSSGCEWQQSKELTECLKVQ